jgi:eukaryotic-like serine/threonine-protein kinase
MRALTIGDHVLNGRFRLVQMLGEGGMGVVWEAIEVTTGRRWAIKILRDEAQTPGAEKRFLREAEAANAVRHPCILHIHEVAYDDDGTPAFVMNLLEGEPLGTRIEREQRLGLGQTAAVLRLVTSALRAAHAAGVVHRDLKPDNIFLTREPNGATGVRVLDFGIARFERPSEKLTVTGTLMGTPVYMSPEQAAGESGLDARTDVWSIGAIAFECLTGATPVEGDNYGQILSRLIRRQIKTLASVPLGLPPEFVSAIDAIFVDRSQRSADLAPLEAVFARYADPRIAPPPGSTLSPAARDAPTMVDAATMVAPRAKSRAVPLVIIGLASLCVVGIVAGGAALRVRANRAPTTVTGTSVASVPPPPPPTAEPAPVVASAAPEPSATPSPSAVPMKVVTTAASTKKPTPPSPSATPRPKSPDRLPGGVAGEVPF